MDRKKSDKKTFGEVYDCFRLNIRKEPNLISDIISVVPAGTKLELCRNFSDAAWYMVIIDGKEGFALKQYVRIKETKNFEKSAMKTVLNTEENNGKHSDIHQKVTRN